MGRITARSVIRGKGSYRVLSPAIIIRHAFVITSIRGGGVRPAGGLPFAGPA